MSEDAAEYPLPEITLAPREEAVVSSAKVSPRGQLYPVGLKINHDAAPLLSVLDIKVGRNSQLVSNTPVPGSVFDDRKRWSVCLLMDAIPGGLVMNINLRNNSDSPVCFRGSVVTQKTKPNGHKYLLGFERILIKPKRSAEICCCSQVNITPTNLLVSRATLKKFEILSMETEKYLDNPSASSVGPGSLTSENLLLEGDISLSPIPTIPISGMVILTARNKTQHDDWFEAALLGNPVLD